MRPLQRIATLLHTALALSSAAPDPLLAASLPARQAPASAASQRFENFPPLDPEFIRYQERADGISKILGLESSRVCSPAFSNLLAGEPIYVAPNQLADVFEAWDHTSAIKRPFVNRGIRAFLSEKKLLELRTKILSTLDTDRAAMRKIESNWQLLEVSYLDGSGMWHTGAAILPNTKPQFATAKLGRWEAHMMESEGALMVSLHVPGVTGGRDFPSAHSFDGWNENSLKASALRAVRENSGYRDDSGILFPGEHALLTQLAANLADPNWRRQLRSYVSSAHGSADLDLVKARTLLWGK
ncbi:MAG: hypothetical protein K1X83_10815 [Oligoflexia bacterium]|nr:hypothetical protein [Oligoflexia bacterium]